MLWRILHPPFWQTQCNQPSQHTNLAAWLLLGNYALHFLPYWLLAPGAASLSEMVLKARGNMKHPAWKQEAETQQVQNPAFAWPCNTTPAIHTNTTGPGQATACHTSTETTLCQKRGTCRWVISLQPLQRAVLPLPQLPGKLPQTSQKEGCNFHDALSHICIFSWFPLLYPIQK